MVAIFEQVTIVNFEQLTTVTPGFRNCISMLIDSGAEIGIGSQDYYGDCFDDNTPYYYAFKMKDRKLLKLFLEKGKMGPYVVEVSVFLLFYV
jgi:hypothetical protein